MANDYTLNWTSDGLKAPFVLAAQSIDTGTTSLALTGRGTSNWGERVQENLIRLLENFAGPTSPGNPTIGQLWFKSTENRLYLYHTGAWTDLAFRRIDSAAQPIGPSFPGDLWYDTNVSILKVYTQVGTWVSVSTQILGELNINDVLRLSGDITPSTLTGDANDYAPTSIANASVLRLATDAKRTLTGITGGTDGRVMIVLNIGSFPLVLSKENSNSSTINRFDLVEDLTLFGKQNAILIYDLTSARWRLLSGPQAPSRETPQSLTDTATITWDTSVGRQAVVTLGGNRTFGAPTNATPGTYILTVKQDATGSRTITWNGVFKWTGGTAPTLSTSPNKIDIITFLYDGTNWYGAFQLDFF